MSGRCSQGTVITWHSDPDIGSTWWQSTEPSEFARLVRYVEPGRLEGAPPPRRRNALMLVLFQIDSKEVGVAL